MPNFEYDSAGNPIAVTLDNGVRTADPDAIRAASATQNNMNAWSNIGNGIANTASDLALGTKHAISKIPTPAENLNGGPAPAALPSPPRDVPLDTVLDPMGGISPVAPLASVPLSHPLSGEQGGAPAAVHTNAPQTQYAPSSGGPGTVDLTGSKTTSASFDPKLQADADKTHAAVQDSVRALAEAETAKNAVSIKRAEAESASLDSFMADENKRRAVEADKVALKEKDYQAEVDKMANTKLTNPHMFYGQSTGNQILAGIAVSLGALSQAMGQPGTKNVGIDAIQSALDRDVAMQKYNMDNQKDITNAKRTMYQDMVKKYGDERAARSAYQEMVMTQVGKEFESRALATNDPIIKAKAQQAAAEADDKAAQAKLERSKILTENTREQKVAPAAERNKPVYVEAAEHDKLQARSEFVSDIRKAQALYSDPKYTKYTGLLNSSIEDVKGKFGGTLPPEYLELRERSQALQQHLQMVTTGMGVNKTELDNLQKQIGQVFESPQNAGSKLSALNKIHTDATTDYARGLNSKYLGHPDVFKYTSSMLGNLDATSTPPGTPMAGAPRS